VRILGQTRAGDCCEDDRWDTQALRLDDLDPQELYLVDEPSHDIQEVLAVKASRKEVPIFA